MLMTQTQYARHRGVSQQAVSKAVRAGKIPLVEGKIESDAADLVWAPQHQVGSGVVVVRPAVETVDAPPAEPDPAPAAAPAASSNPTERQAAITFAMPTEGTAASEQAALARARREKLEFEMELRRGEWVPLRDVEQAWSDHVIAVRNRLLLIPDGITDPTIRAQVDRLIREALADVSRIRIENQSQEAPAA